MVRSGHTLDGPGSLPRPGWAGIGSVTLRDFSAGPARRRPILLDQHLLILVTVGHGTQEVDFRSYPCRPGSLIWARPGQLIRHGGQAGLDAILVCWDQDALPGLLAGPAAQPFGPGYWQLAGEDEDAVINEVSQLVVDCQRHPRTPLAVDLLRHQLAVLLLRLALLPAGAPTMPDRPPGRGGDWAGASGPAVRRGPVPSPREGDAPASGTVASSGPWQGGPGRNGAGVFWRLRQEVERSYGQTRRVEDYADRLECSVRTLTRACLAVTGRSAKQVIDDRVALQAMRLLAATDTPIADIGRCLGFAEPTNFGRFFHREVGRSPGAFRAGQAGRTGSPPTLPG